MRFTLNLKENKNKQIKMNNLWNVSIKKPATEYKNEYKIHDINTRPSFKPDNYYKALREPIQEETTNR